MTSNIPESPEVRDQLERDLAALSRWEGEVPEAWRKAANRDRAGRGRPISGFLTRPFRLGPFLAAAAVLAIVATVVILPSLSKARRVYTGAGPAAELSGASMAPESEAEIGSDGGGMNFNKPTRDDSGYLGATDQTWRFRSARPVQPAAGAGSPPPPAPADSADRHVVRKATIELQTKDVRAAFLKASLLVNEAFGEYIEASGLTGEADSAQANLTLRITANRLPAVLQSLRELAKVTAENATGDDVTDQVVDLEARIRNEQRAEAELLELMAKREDAPLKEILDLRTTIASIRSDIERMAAQRERLSRLTSLATILVIIRTDTTPEPEPEQGLLGYFLESIGDAWRGGMSALIDTVAAILSIAVGGLIFWLAAIGATIGAVTLYRRSQRRAALEPAPAV